jgi:hypothetical protein
VAVSLEGTFKLIDLASPALRRIEARAQAADRALEKLGRTMDRMAAREQVQKIGNLSSAMRGLEGDTNRVEKAFGRASTSTARNRSELDRHTASVKKSHNEMGRLEAAMRKVLVIGGGLGKVLAPAKFLGIAAAIRPLIGAVAALGAGADRLEPQLVSASGAIVPMIARLGDLAGAGAVAATAFISLKVATLTTKFAMNGVKQAINGNAAALKKLTPEARSFVAEMKKLQPVMNQLRASAQQGLFPGLTSAIKQARASGGFQVANQALRGAGSAVGGVASSAAARLTSPQMLSDLGTQFKTINVVISRMGAVAINVADAFHNILFAAQPLTRWATGALVTFSKYLLQQTQIARETGRLGAYFGRTRATLTALAHTVRDFGMGFLNIMRVARGESQNFGGGIEKLAKTFRNWTEDFNNQGRMALWFQRAQVSAHTLGHTLVNLFGVLSGIGKAASGVGGSVSGQLEKATRRWSNLVNSFAGQSKLKAWMDGMKSTLNALWGLASDLGGAFARMSAGGGGAAGLLTQIRSILPDIEKVLTNISKNIGPGLFGTIGQIFHLLGNLTAGTGPLGMFFNLTNSILGMVNSILDRFKLVGSAIGTAFIVIGGALFLRKLLNIGVKVQEIAMKWMGVKTATERATIAAAEYEAVTRGGAGMMPGGVRGARAVPGGSGLIRTDAPGFIGPTMGGSQPGMPGFVGPMMPARRGGFRGMLGRAGGGLKGGLGGIMRGGGGMGGMGLAIAAPMLVGAGTQFAQSKGWMGGKRASQTMNVAQMAGTGAMIGSVIPGVGTLAGGVIGAGAGLLMNELAPRDDQAKKYQDRFAGVAQKHGFDASVVGGGAKSLAGEERYQHLLDRSLTTMRNQKAEALAKYGISVKDYDALSKGDKKAIAMGDSKMRNLDEQIAANQVIRGQNIEKLGIDRADAKALAHQNHLIAVRARQKGGQTLGAKYVDSLGGAYAILRKGGPDKKPMSEAAARKEILDMAMSRIKKSTNPAFVRQVMAQVEPWMEKAVKANPKLGPALKSWDSQAKGVMDKLGAHVTTVGGKVLAVTGPQWTRVAQSVVTPLEQMKAQAQTAFTDIQNQASAMLVASGWSPVAARWAVLGTESGGAMPSLKKKPGKGGLTGAFAPVPTGLAPPAGARGMRIPGSGNRDTVPIGGATGIGAPGELVVNRHTERRVNKLLGIMGTSLGAEVAGETAAHSDILPGLAKGGRLGRAIAEANRIDALKSKYLYGGGHVTPAPAVPPWDCSSSTSRVLQVAGYDVPTQVSGDYMKWGEPGPGSIGISASKGHVFMVLNGRAWGTSRQNPGGGPGWISGGYRPGFTTRHAPGPGSAGGAGVGGFPPMLGPLPFSQFATGLGGIAGMAALGQGQMAVTGLRAGINNNLANLEAAQGGLALGGRIPRWGGWKAGGMDGVVSRPTLIGVGERGAERVTVGPAHAGGRGGLSIGHLEINVHGHQPGDVRREVEAALLEVARSIDNSPSVGGG